MPSPPCDRHTNLEMVPFGQTLIEVYPVPVADVATTTKAILRLSMASLCEDRSARQVGCMWQRKEL